MLSAEAAGVEMFGVLGVAIKNAATLREAIDVCTRFIQINTTASTLTRAPIPGTEKEMIVLDNAYPLGPETVQLYERLLGTILQVAKTVGLPPETPIEYRFMHAPVSSLAAYSDALGSTPKFNQPSMGIVFNRDLLDVPIAHRSLELGELAMNHMRNITENAEKPFVESARHISRVLIELGACSQSELATALNIHERTLQRRLKEAGSSFEAVRDEARREIAAVLLRQNAHSLTDIALILGYAESSTFSRSCQRWFGDTPSSIRAQAEAG